MEGKMCIETLEKLTVEGCFPEIEATGTNSGAVAFLNFKDTASEISFAEAVLFPKGSNCRGDFDPDSYTYPIFFPDGEVEVIIHWEMDQTRSRRLKYAIITCTSTKGEVARAIHYLTDF
jgi:hypothetical protein